MSAFNYFLHKKVRFLVVKYDISKEKLRFLKLFVTLFCTFDVNNIKIGACHLLSKRQSNKKNFIN